MRKFKLLVLTIVFASTSLMAFNTESPEKTNKAIRNQIVDLLHPPGFTIENEMNLTITFTFSSEGEIVVLNVDSSHNDLLNYVRKHLNYQKIENPGLHNKIYQMPLKIERS